MTHEGSEARHSTRPTHASVSGPCQIPGHSIGGVTQRRRKPIQRRGEGIETGTGEEQSQRPWSRVIMTSEEVNG